MKHWNLDGIRRRLEAVQALDPTVIGSGSERQVLLPHLGGLCELRMTRDTEPAGAADRAFAFHALADVPFLLAAVDGGGPFRAQLDEIEGRVGQASPGPWRPFLGTDGGTGGCTVILVGGYDDDEEDMYFWLGPDLAPDALFTFFAEARQDIPSLLSAFADRKTRPPRTDRRRGRATRPRCRIPRTLRRQ